MSRVSIVGVDGSGKTVLMAALGERYETPDEYGFFLSAETPQTFHTVKMLMDRMRHGMWPAATTTDTVTSLDWTLYRKSGSQNISVSEMAFLDYAGEIYRLGFGEHSDEEKKAYAAQIAALQEHMKSSDILIVLINLKDIISGNYSDPKTREMMWISKSILDFAVMTAKIPNVALAFSQYEVYRDAIEEAGGLEGAYRKYLRHVENMYPDLKLFAVSAVDKTEIDDSGYEIPARDFSSQGLDLLVEWIVSKIPGHENDIADIKELPSRLWVSLKSEVSLFLDDSSGALCSRLEHAKNATETLAKFADIGTSRRNAVATEEDVLKLRTQIETFKSQAEHGLSVYSELVALDVEKSSDELRAWFVAHDVSENLVDKLIEETETEYRIREEQRQKAKGRRRGFLIAASFVLVAALALGGWKWWENHQRQIAAELARKVNIGYSSCLVDGKRVAKWIEGHSVPANKYLRTDVREGRYVAVRPGYVWIPGTVEDRWSPGSRWIAKSDDIVADVKEGEWRSNRAGYRVVESGTGKTLEWVPGMTHPNNPILKSDTGKDSWICVKSGYKWEGGERTSWCSGIKHPSDTRLVASEKEGVWTTSIPGYVWDGEDKAIWKPGQQHAEHVGIFSGEKEGVWVTDKPGYGVDANYQAVWRQGLRHPNNKRLVSASTEGQWTTTEPGYEWAGGSLTKWNAGVSNPFNSSLKASTTEGEWISTQPGYRWAGGSKTEWQEGVRHPDNSNLISTASEGQWKSTRGEGWVWDGGSGEKWQAGIKSIRCPHWVTAEKENHGRPEPGYKKKDETASGWCELVWSPGMIDSSNGANRKASSIEGRWLHQVDCSICDGTGRKSAQVDCSRCNGRGIVDGQVQCSTCGGNGQVNGFVSCPQCGGKGSANFKCENPVHNMICVACGGRGQVNFGFGWMPCGGCGGTGRLRCWQCNNTGSSWQICNRCSGTGRNQATVNCSSCGGSGNVDGTVTCPRCDGRRQVSGKVSCTHCGRDGCANGKVWERD